MGCQFTLLNDLCFYIADVFNECEETSNVLVLPILKYLP